MKFELFRDRRGDWRWRFKAANGHTIAVSSEGYVRKCDCRRMIGLLSKPGVPIEVLK